jgi:nicotinamidase/pyrazinamidase
MSNVCSGKVALANSPADSPIITVHHGDALLVVDVQRDFLPGGSLAVPGGEEVIGPLNRYLARFVQRNLPVFVSGDCHPPDHGSFQAQGGPWPSHCVINTQGAAFAENLSLPYSANVVRKGTTPECEGYSAFDGTDLQGRLCAAKVLRLFVGGLATDHCVLHTVRDAIELGFKTFVLRDAIRAVNASPKDGEMAEAEMAGLGATFIQLEDLLRAH